MLDQKDLEAIAQLMDIKLEPINKRLNDIDSRLDAMQEDIAIIKEDAAITRSATNSLIEWADLTHERVGKPIPEFPIMHRAEG